MEVPARRDARDGHDGSFHASVPADASARGIAAARHRSGIRPAAICTGERYARPGTCAIHYAVAGLMFALVFALAARFVYPFRLDLPGFLIGVWIYAWPVVLALPLIVPGPMRRGQCASRLLRCVPALGAMGSLDRRYPRIQVRRSRAAGPFLGDAVGNDETLARRERRPTVLMLFCFNRWVRAVAPLVLALVTTAISGTWIAFFALFSREASMPPSRCRCRWRCMWTGSSWRPSCCRWQVSVRSAGRWRAGSRGLPAKKVERSVSGAGCPVAAFRELVHDVAGAGRTGVDGHRPRGVSRLQARFGGGTQNPGLASNVTAG